ncbi:MAG TPA: hypothetical protein VM557_03240 [Thermoanaerobaculia bacterium]|nr:hypothetical protein [Thermoanaerobaculia bacterium]
MAKKLSSALTLTAMILIAAAAQAGSTSAQIGVSVQVIGRTIVNVSPDPIIEITAEDIERGWLETESASVLSIRSNKRAGYRLAFSPTAPWVAGLDVEGLEAPLSLGSEGGSVGFAYRGTKPQTYEVRYRIHLNPNVVPGTYPLPVAVATLN